MATSRADLLLHPVRLRVVLAMGGEDRTTGELSALLPDVAPATLYRHVASLFEGGVLEVVDERRNRGGVERTYRLVEAAASIDGTTAEAIPMEQVLSGLVTFVDVVVDAMTRYAQHPDAGATKHPLGYHQVPLWLTGDEAEALARDVGDVIEAYRGRGPSEQRTKVTFNTIVVPELS